MPKFGNAISDELRYAVSDIRTTWERLWFGRDLTPEPASVDIQGNPVDDGRSDWDERCKAFFSPSEGQERAEGYDPSLQPDLDR